MALESSVSLATKRCCQRQHISALRWILKNLAQTSIHNLRAKRVSRSLRNCGIEKGERRKPLRAHKHDLQSCCAALRAAPVIS